MEGTHPGKRPRAGACYEPADVAKARALAQRREEEKGDEGGRGAAVGLLPWQNTAARICRVSRASGGKDRHSKVLTAKGLRDRRVRLSVSTAIQFYDLQDRLGYDQPSKAVEWLIKAASAAIAELPSLDGAFAELSSRLARRAQNEGVDGLQQHYQQQQHLSLTKSTCSSTSETSRGSVLSLSRCDSHAKAREKAKERTSGEKGERQHDIDAGAGTGGSSHHQSAGRNPTSQCSFTDLLTGSNCQEDTMVTVAQANSNSDPNPGVIQIPHGYVHRHMRAVTADYFDQKPPHLQGVPAHFIGGGGGGSSPMPFGFAHTAGDGEHAGIPQQLPFLQDHLGPVTAVAGNGGDYSLNFSIASGLTGFNRGTLQSNSPSLFTHHAHHHLQRIPSQVADAGGTSLPFFFSTMHPVVTTTSGENSFAAGIDGRLQICYGDGYRHSDIKGKEKN